MSIPSLPVRSKVLGANGYMSAQWLKALQELLRPRVTFSSGTLANIPQAHNAVTNPRGLKEDDAGYIYEATDYAHLYEWTGTAWRYAPGDRASGEVAWFTAAPGTGWALCNGGAATRSTATGGTAAFTTPNLIGSFVKGASAYTGTVEPASATTITGSTGSAGSHNHGGSASVSVTVTGETVFTGNGTTGSLTVGADGVHSGTATIGSDGAHTHGAGTLTATSGEPQHVELLPYFRI